MAGYYEERLAAERLRRCYEIAPPRVQRYLEAEIAFVRRRLEATSSVLELGCGYGRVLSGLLGRASHLVGIDTSLESLRLARKQVGASSSCALVASDAAALGFRDGSFDVVACIQNGISAFHVDRRQLIREAVRVTRGGGTVLFSSYLASFWKERLAWFRIQAAEGLLGEIDEEATGDGVIVCRDGFRATTIPPEEFTSLTAGLAATTKIVEVEESSLFCEIRVW